MRFARSSDPDRLRAFLSSKLAAPLSYPEVGASLGDPPVGYRHDHDTVTLGTGAATFDGAVRGLQEWQAHRAAGVVVFPPDAALELGVTVALGVPLPGFHTLAACRIVAVVDEPDRFGFAYGTIVGHPEQGEEAFLVERAGDTVTFRVNAFSRPSDPLARLGAPIARRIQRRVTKAYLTGLRDFVSTDRPT